MCGSRKLSIPMREGGSTAKIYKGKYEAELEIPGWVGVGGRALT